jgi:hypothetical protein
VLAAVLAVGARAPAVLRRMASAEALVAEAERLLALPRDERIRAAVSEARALLADVPAGMARVHESWIEAGLAGEGEAVRRALAGGGGAPDAVRLWLRRRFLGQLVPMPEGEPPADRPPQARELPLLAAPRLVAAFEIAGRRRLALALSAAGSGAAAALAARLGAEHGRALVEDVARPAAKEEVRAAVRELADLVAGDVALLLFRAGARSVAPALLAAGGDVARQLAQRLPRGRGLVLLDEVARVKAPDAGRLALLVVALSGG